MFKFIKDNSYDIVKMGLNQLGIAMLAIIMTMATHQNDALFVITSILCIIFYLYLLYTMTYDIGQKDKPRLDGGRMEFKPLRGLWLAICANSVNILCGIMVAVFSFFIIYQPAVTLKDANGVETEAYYKIELYAQQTDENQNVIQDAEYQLVKLGKLYCNVGGDALVTTEEISDRQECEVKDQNNKSIVVYDKDGNELFIYTDSAQPLCAKRSAIKNWASNLYALPYTLATFLQCMFKGVHGAWFNNSDFFFLFTPVLPIAVCALAYYNGAKGKRILFFLPEMKTKPRRG